MKEAPRRLWHIFGGLCLAVAGLLAPEDIFLPALLSATGGLLIFEAIRLKSPRLNRSFSISFRALMREREASTLTSSAWLLIAACIVFIFCSKPVAVIAVTFVGVGDPVAGIVAEKWRQRRQKQCLPSGQGPDRTGGSSPSCPGRDWSSVWVKVKGKSLAGSMACLGACLVAGAVLASITHLAFGVVIVGAICATAVEWLSLPPNDNLTMPLVTAGIMSLGRLLSG
jgi:dolichol kinase